MATDTVEIKAINKLEGVLLKSDYIMPNIAKNDKTPSWDGDIMLYSKDNHEKEKLEGRIPVQVKGKTVETFTGECKYAFEWADLDNYYKDKGCLYFVVQLLKESEEFQVFYRDWTFVELFNLFDKYPKPREHKSINLPLKAFPLQKQDIESLLFTLLHDLQKQMTVPMTEKLPSLEEYDGSPLEMGLVAFGEAKNKLPLELLTQEARYLYKKTPNGIVPIKDGKVLIKLSVDKDLKISVAGQTYYDQCTIRYEQGRTIYCVGGSMEFEIQKNKLVYRVTLSDSLKQRLNDLDFIFAAVANGSFDIADVFQFDVSGLAGEKETIEIWKKQKEELMFYQQFLELINVHEDLQLDKLTPQDESRLNTIINAIVRKELIKIAPRKSVFGIIPVANLNIIVAYEEVSRDGDICQYRMHTIKDVKIETHVGKKKVAVEVPFISYVRHEKPELIAKISNLDWEHLAEDYARFYSAFPDFYTETATYDMLEILTCYDKDPKEEWLHYALPIAEWLSQSSKKKVSQHTSTINKMQILMRQRQLEEMEQDELAAVIAESPHHFVKYGAYLLLGDMACARYWYKRISKEEREKLDTQPISRFKKF